MPTQQRRPLWSRRLPILAGTIVALLVFLVGTALVADWLGITFLSNFRMVVAVVLLVPWIAVMLVRPELFRPRSDGRQERQSEED
jgi:hypothetical protein